MSFKFKIINSKVLPEVKKIIHSCFKDKRGTIHTTIDNNLVKKILPKKFYFNQNKVNYRKKNVLVGIHYDHKTWKLLSCIRGKIFHVVTNINGNNKNRFKSNYLRILSITTNITPKINQEIESDYFLLIFSPLFYFLFSLFYFYYHLVIESIIFL